MNDGNCDCDTGYVDDGSSAVCLTCGYKCLSCSDPSDLNVCDTC